MLGFFRKKKYTGAIDPIFLPDPKVPHTQWILLKPKQRLSRKRCVII